MARTTRELLEYPLSASLQRALLLLLGTDEAIHHAKGWKIPNRPGYLHQQTVEALWTRYLVKIVVESRHRRRQTAKLTDTGRHVAHGLLTRRSWRYLKQGEQPKLSEAAQKLIVELVDATLEPSPGKTPLAPATAQSILLPR